MNKVLILALNSIYIVTLQAACGVSVRGRTRLLTRVTYYCSGTRL